MPTCFRAEIVEEIVDLGEMIVILITMGNILYYILLTNSSGMSDADETLNLSMILLSFLAAFIYILLPNKRITRSMCKRRKKPTDSFNQPLLYDQFKEYFQNDYDDVDPVIRDKLVPHSFVENYKAI
mmetsp:Transcript_4951/g.4147  ORF Transcript_4951/g.4147 Transcript_4951/m.4147 type:complete len:127 (-) Transcript_4951:797-1177(-)